MKRLLGLGVLIAIVIGALGSHGKAGTVTSAATQEPAPTVPDVRSKPSRHHAPRVSYSRCDQNISVGPATTCGFADNVFRAFAQKVSSQGGSRADYTVRAASPVTGKTYTMACRTIGESTVCAGGNSARVRFPLSAAEVYYRASPPITESESDSGEESEAEGEAEAGSPSAEPECTSGSYVNSAGNVVCSPEESPSGPPAGATAECADGTYSFSESRSGTCSHHGGVASWL